MREWGEEIRARNFDGHTPVMPVRTSVVSGHGVGKSALTAWIADFITSTRPHSKGIVTANTAPQLETKTWAEIVKWKRRGLTSPLVPDHLGPRRHEDRASPAPGDLATGRHGMAGE